MRKQIVVWIAQDEGDEDSPFIFIGDKEMEEAVESDDYAFGKLMRVVFKPTHEITKSETKITKL